MAAPLTHVVPEAGAAILGIGFAIVVWRLGHGRANRPLIALLLLDGLDQAMWTAADLSPDGSFAVNAFVGLGIFLFTVSVIPYLLILRQLATPLVRPLQMRGVVPVTGGVLVVVGALPLLWLVTNGGAYSTAAIDIPTPLLVRMGASVTAIGCVLAFAFVAAFSAFRRARVGTGSRARARAYTIAFGARDIIYVIAMILNIGVVAMLNQPQWATYFYPIWSIATLAYVPLLAIGILRTELFDLDLKIKIGIQRGTIASVALAAVFVISKIVEAYASKEFGFVAGAIAAGMILFMAPRLNRLGDKVANVAMPKVQPTEGYMTFKKLEVYRAAVESALENDHKIDGAERAMLDRLRVKLQLDAADCAQLEAEAVTQTHSQTLANAL